MSSIVFGGSGFIGQQLIKLLDEDYFNLDIEKGPSNYLYCDVRNSIDLVIPTRKNSVIYNLAALCTIPKYEEREYYETNILGAENVCNLARAKDIKTIVFTSSISPYGMREDERTEISLPMPTNEYGISKLVAEEIHKRWQAEKPDERKLIIVRPGVVFGFKEGGNFTRLYKAIKKGGFFYPGRKDTKKAAIYVKDLVRIIMEMVEKENPGVHLFNTVYTPVHTIEEICKTMAKVTGVKEPKVTLPSDVLILGASLINGLSKLIGKSFNGIHPDRVKKLMTSTNICGKKLLINRYKPEYSLLEAITDWYNDCNSEGLY